MTSSINLHHIDIDYLKSLLLSRWKQIVIIFLAVALPATMVSLSKPVNYPVSSRLLFEQNRRVNLELSSQLSERASRSIMPPEKLNSQIEVIKGNQLMRKLVRAIGFSGDEDAESREVMRLQEKIQVRVIPASTIIEISYSDTDSQKAVSVVNTLTSLFQDFYSNTVEGVDAVKFYEDRFQQTDYNLKENHRKLEALLASEGLVTNYSQTRQIVADRVISIENQISESAHKASDLEAKIAFLKKVLVNQPKQARKDIEYYRNPNIDTLEDQLAVLEMERNTLSTKYTENSREMQDKEEEIRLLKGLRDKSVQLVEGKVIHSVNPLYEEAEKELTFALASLKGLKSSKEQMAASLVSSREQLVRLNHLAYQFAAVENAVAVETKTHSFYLQKLKDARFLEAMTDNEITSVSIIQRAEAPVPTKKPAYVSAAMSSGLGAIIALAIAFLLDFLRPKLRSVEEIGQFLRLPVIGTVTQNGFKEELLSPKPS